MKRTLIETKSLRKDEKPSAKNIYYYNLEKILNSHLKKQTGQNKVNDLFSKTSNLSKALNTGNLVAKLKETFVDTNLCECIFLL